jgi:hypothetical protein
MSLRQKSSKGDIAIFRIPKCDVPSAEDWRLFMELGRPSWRHRNIWHFSQICRFKYSVQL